MKHLKFKTLLFAFVAVAQLACAQKQPVFVPGGTGNKGEENNNKDKKYICLSFDDGPHVAANSTSMAVLDLLEKYDVPASFFVIGSRIQNNPEGAKKIMERGLSLGCEYQNHSLTHQRMATFSAADIKNEINTTNKLIKEITGVTPRFFRPPYINMSTTLHENIDMYFIRGRGCNDSKKEVTAQMRIDSILENPTNGEILLLHDFGGNQATVDALDVVIPELKKRGFTFVTVSELFKLRGEYPDLNNGKIYTNPLTDSFK